MFLKNLLPDHKALDDIVFDILGLTEDERNEVYWAVLELVKNRLEKARSVWVRIWQSYIYDIQFIQIIFWRQGYDDTDDYKDR